LYAPELSYYIFRTTESAQPIRYMAVLPVLAGLREISTSILWAQDRKSLPIAGLIAGIALNLAIVYVLAAIPGFGYLGISIGIIAMEAVAVAWNLRALQAFHLARKRALPLLSDLCVFILAIFAVSGLHRMFAAASDFGLFTTLCSVVLFTAFSGFYIKTRSRSGMNFK
ncbi:MAG: polysaccharide biosynthesis C-terminal domain-containing protein, partial [Cohnella sp.]|nr:polysaccharide biosynthesis C-terminal domain-containing protein [Cohnella sp.]